MDVIDVGNDVYMVFLLKIKGKVRKPLRVDKKTLFALHGHHARICVEVDLSKPLLSKFRLRCRIRRIEYEAMHLKEKCKCSGEQPNGEIEEQVLPANLIAPALMPYLEVIKNNGKWMPNSRPDRE
ncbi:conserved hypothetical protein [Ricinus communis]|uniref:Uncharacterized protein n=1 Tax=Ricinus communis TaxID=3988 RepID=B9RQ44_RICCO|nr:conserved hypothetical protein [Ricinus communis]